MRLPTFLSALAISAVGLATFPSAQGAKLERCNPNDSQSTCPKSQYCLAAKPHSYCTKKLDGGKECTKDDACKSDICFIAKERHGKRVCASLPLSNYPLNAQCTQSKQCKSGYCFQGFCKKAVAAGESCSKDVACAERSKGATCLTQAATFVVYDSAGKKRTKKLSAGKCSYVSDLGEDSSCTSNANCYSAKFTCSKKTKKCKAIAVTPSDPLPYQATCSKGKECSSGACVEGKCGCTARGSDCDHTEEYCSADAVCQPLSGYGQSCDEGYECFTGMCTAANPVSRSLSKRITEKVCGCIESASCGPGKYCQDQTNLCVLKRAYDDNCSTSDQCRSGLCTGDFTCGCQDDSACSGSDICETSTNKCVTAPPTNLPYLEDCQVDSNCASGHCVSGHCGCSVGSSDCIAPQYCNSADATCKVKGDYGANCQSNEDCLQDLCVTQQVTRSLRSFDKRVKLFHDVCGCTSDDVCAGDQFCDEADSNTCAAKRYFSDSCETDNQCLSDHCNEEFCGCDTDDQCVDADAFCSEDATCVSQVSDGSWCDRGAMCTSGVCDAGSCS